MFINGKQNNIIRPQRTMLEPMQFADEIVLFCTLSRACALSSRIIYSVAEQHQRMPAITEIYALSVVVQCRPVFCYVGFLVSLGDSDNTAHFYSASALLAMQTAKTAVIATADLSVCLSVCHVPVFCPDE